MTPPAPPIARKRFGQHFLHDPGVIERILTALAPRRGEAIVEIGPGLGALTLPLLEEIDHLEVIELDRDVIPHLRSACPDESRLVIHSADALRFDFAALAHRLGGPLRLVGNLPYNVATPLLFRLLEGQAPVKDMTFMVQLEVAQRLAAGAGSEDYGRLSVTSFVHARTELLFSVGPGAFRPPPKVTSAVVRMVPRPPPFEVPPAFGQVVTAAFAQRRKTLRNALRAGMSDAGFAQAGIDAGCRAEEIDPEGFARLARAWKSP